MEIEDAYKWLFHATLGGEHAVRDDSGPRAWLDREWDVIGEPLPGEANVVELRPDGKIVRVNLRPYKAAGGDKETMLQVFVASARRFHAERVVFETAWSALGERLKEGPIGRIDRSGWVRLDHEARAEGYPAIEHSENYLRAQNPAYRVVLKDLWGYRV
jgi:hypothetical protein